MPAPRRVAVRGAPSRAVAPATAHDAPPQRPRIASGHGGGGHSRAVRPLARPPPAAKAAPASLAACLLARLLGLPNRVRRSMSHASAAAASDVVTMGPARVAVGTPSSSCGRQGARQGRRLGGSGEGG